MSYNYDQCLASIQEHRLKAYENTSNSTSDASPNPPDLNALQRSMDELANLSKHCPMTPLLWMQYAQDTENLMHGLHLLDPSSSFSARGEGKDDDLHQLHAIQAKKEALEASAGILELALAEFPGCSLLHLYYLESLAEYFYQTENEALHHLIRSESEDGAGDLQSGREKLSRAFEAAWENVGRGSHVNEGMVVSEIYRLHGAFLLACLSREVRDLAAKKDSSMDVERDGISKIIQQFSLLFGRWSKTPMGEGSNDEMMEDFNYIWDEALSILSDLSDETRVKQMSQFKQQRDALLGAVDENRRSTSSLANILSSHENEIDVAMSNEGISFPHSCLQQRDEATKSDASGLGKHLETMKRVDSKWDAIILGNGSRWLLGLGAVQTSGAFARYASFLQRGYQSLFQKGGVDIPDSFRDHIAVHKQAMISCVYERAVSECPTVETLWLSYHKFLRGEWIRIHDKLEQPGAVQEEISQCQQELEKLSSALKSVSHRSIRNCPYSSNLFELRMTTLGLLSTSNLEPDDITAVVQEATQLGFLSANREAMLSMRLVAITVVKRKLLSLISLGTTSLLANGVSNGVHMRGKDYDQDEDIVSITPSSPKNKNKATSIQYKSLAPNAMEEIQDLIEDIRDMYEETDNYLFKSHSSWVEGKVCFWKHRSLTEAYVLGPVAFGLRNALGSDDVSNELADKETLKCFEKLVKAQKPCHPDSWREYLRYASTAHLHFLGDEPSQSSPGDVGAVPAELRQTRGLYKRAMSSIRKAGKSTHAAGSRSLGVGIYNALFQRDHDLALLDLCHEYLDFEQTFGSEESLSAALTLVRSKMANYDATVPLQPVDTSASEENGKRKLDSDEPTKEDQMHDDDDGDDTGESRSKRTKVKTNLKEPKKTDAVHKVRIGKMDYPAHPFTIHVSNLDKETQDMDLVDAFRTTCGAIVHAKIIREKMYGKGGHHAHGESKGSGLVQFEERMSVEKALEQNGELQIGGRVVKIHRSHMPAVGVVPQGMHRVNPKGEGKMSKRNNLKKKQKHEGDDDVSMECDDGDKGTTTEAAAATGELKGDGASTNKKNKYRTSSSPGSIKMDALSFKPRVVKQKPKIALGNSTKK